MLLFSQLNAVVSGSYQVSVRREGRVEPSHVILFHLLKWSRGTFGGIRYSIATWHLFHFTVSICGVSRRYIHYLGFRVWREGARGWSYLYWSCAGQRPQSRLPIGTHFWVFLEIMRPRIVSQCPRWYDLYRSFYNFSSCRREPRPDNCFRQGGNP